jgi:hypothetical protein
MNTTTRNYPLIFIRSVTWALMLLAAGISASHIIHAWEMLQLPAPYSYTTPLFIDLIAIAGKLSMLPRFDRYPAFQRSGRRMLMVMGGLSLAANIGAGSTWGERGYGLLIVGGFLFLENHLTKAAGKVKETPVAETVKMVRTPKDRLEAARKRGGYYQMTKTERAAWTKRYNERIAKNAPTSPAWVLEGREPSEAETASITASITAA